MKILVADDDKVSRRLNAAVLESVGYQVIQVENGRAALRELSNPQGPRLALIDWMMPEMDGPDVCYAIRKLHGQPYIYVILLTSRQSHQDIVAGLEAGADDYLTKPCNPEELKARLRSGQRILQLEDKLVEAREEMRFKATHDHLTSLWDRGAILSHLCSELRHSLHDHASLSLLLCDVDCFKQINDAHGHLVGDQVLRQVGERLLHSVRPHDMVGRYGGEEFLLILKECDGMHIHDRADEVREAVVNRPFFTDRGPLSISISIGAVAVHHESRAPALELLLAQADKALYRAKSKGRNCVVSAESLIAGAP